jgi:hypothetical protein
VWQSADTILGEYLPTGNKEQDAKMPGMGGVFNSANLGLYTYTHQNPLKYLDPDGNAPNQAGATNASVIRNEIRGYENAGMSHSEALSALSSAHGGNQNRYFHTDEFGWVDVRHFGKAAELANDTGSNVLVEALGVGNEVSQWLQESGNDYRSGFSPEDIPSNAAGARFGESLDPKQSLSDQFESWLKSTGSRDTNDPKSGYQSLPATDPAVRGGQNRGPSNLGSKGPGNNDQPPAMDIIAP